jgi:hypothetical protein
MLTRDLNNRNYNFASNLPTGLVCLATNQIAGRGKSFIEHSEKAESDNEIKKNRKRKKFLGITIWCIAI